MCLHTTSRGPIPEDSGRDRCADRCVARYRSRGRRRRECPRRRIARHPGRVLAFGAAALLYLVTEELLVEAHETPDTNWHVIAFFAGFIILFALEG